MKKHNHLWYSELTTKHRLHKGCTIRTTKVADEFKGIDGIETTDELLTSRAGMAILSSYVHKTGILDCRISWSELRRVIYTRRTRTVSGQMEFFGPDALYYTNIAWSPERIIDLAHSRGEAELVHRRLKDFADETLPFKRFALNEAWFYLMLIAFDLFQMVKEDNDADLETASMYPTTFRRVVIDTAGKISRHAGKTILKTKKTVYARLSMLWDIAAPALYPITP